MCTAIVQQYNACNIHTILLLTHRAGAVGIAVERRGALRPAGGGEPKACCEDDCAQDQGSGRRVHIWTSAMQRMARGVFVRTSEVWLCNGRTYTF